MTRDMALRVDMLLTGVRASLDSIASYMKNHVSREDLTQEELTKYSFQSERAWAPQSSSQECFMSCPQTSSPTELK